MPPASGTGIVTSTPAGINCPGTCSTSFAKNTRVQLSASPANNYFFEGWSGGCSGNGTCVVSMAAAENVAATFAAGDQLNVAVAGSGTGTITSSPAGIQCPSTCSATFPPDAQITLIESPNSNDAFSSWSGACSGAGNCTVTLNADMQVTANFTNGAAGGGSAAPVAFIYVATNTGQNSNQIEAYISDETGQLSPVTGSPFGVNAIYITASGRHLFTTDGVNIDSYSVGSDGAITQASSIAANQNNANGCGSPASLFADRTGSTLYDLDYLSDCANNQYQSFSIDGSTGALKFVAISDAASPVFMRPLSFLGNDQFAYSASCYHYFQEIFGFKRNSDGSLTSITSLGSAPPMPEAPTGDAYCPWLAAADSSNHVAVSLSPLKASSFQSDGPTQIAVYTASGSGNLSTSNTAANMPPVAVGTLNDMQTSMAGDYLAVAGTGLQIFKFNGENPVTQLTGLLTSSLIDQVAWDKANHVYAISKSDGKLFVFTVSPAGAVQAPGSPYTLSSPVNLAILPTN